MSLTAKSDVASPYLRFESLGSNCEFGLVQRGAGVEPLGLFRFSEIDLPNVIRALRTECAGIEEFALEVDSSGGYMATGKGIRHVTHTWLYPDTVTPDAAAAKFRQRQIFLRRLLLEHLKEAEKIFVLRTPDQPPRPHIEEVVAALRRYGPNVLLLVTAALGDRKAGDVEAVGTGLLRGYLDKTPHNITRETIEYAHWQDICHRALALRGRVQGD